MTDDTIDLSFKCVEYELFSKDDPAYDTYDKKLLDDYEANRFVPRPYYVIDNPQDSRIMTLVSKAVKEKINEHK